MEPLCGCFSGTPMHGTGRRDPIHRDPPDRAWALSGGSRWITRFTRVRDLG
ncbi:hypothetical protein EHYA_04347 [Embleya hyalina]|uniref:Uncharacterized protein n=1 Tax=Embleya hyalina TaxID=516124 RepID=A0A401YPZ5_9ACTN|nr:hypothetical protein EHYA_04347 [Embleya hyalina]